MLCPFYLGYVSDLESLKSFRERQVFSQWFGMESPLCHQCASPEHLPSTAPNPKVKKI